MPTIIIATAILGEEGKLSLNRIGIEGEGNGAFCKIKRCRIACIKIITLLTGELCIPGNGKDRCQTIGEGQVILIRKI